MGDTAGIQNTSFGECKGDSSTELCIHITTANISDRDGAVETFFDHRDILSDY